VREKNGRRDPKVRAKRIVLSTKPEWERAAKAACADDVKAWLIEVADREAGVDKADDSGEGE
jgi:hypothetical protein